MIFAKFFWLKDDLVEEGKFGVKIFCNSKHILNLGSEVPIYVVRHKQARRTITTYRGMLITKILTTNVSKIIFAILVSYHILLRVICTFDSYSACKGIKGTFSTGIKQTSNFIEAP